MNKSYNPDKYNRQILLKELGDSGQLKLLNSKVLVIGAGGLGCPALLYLAAAGVGTIGIVDYDTIDVSNLHRQILYSVADIGKSKAETAATKLNALNPDVKIQTFNLKLDNKNALEIIGSFDLVIDGSDNFSTRYLVNDACALLNKPLVYGAVLKFEGQVGVLNMADKVSGLKTNYRDLFPKPPNDSATLTCNEAGVLGVVPGIIGTMQATEAIKIITGIGTVLCNKIVTYNTIFNSLYEIRISPNDEGRKLIPNNETEFIAFNYLQFCEIGSPDFEISVEEFDSLKTKEDILIVDVREKGEQPIVSEFKHDQISLSVLENRISEIEFKTIVFFCQTGRRSKKAVEIAKRKNPYSKVLSLSGGIIEWKIKQTVSL